MVSLLSWHAELRSTQDEVLTNIATAVSRIQGHLTNIVHRSEDEARLVQDRITELETEERDTSRELNGLWELNQELQQEASRSNPETERAIDARNAAIRKLNHSRKVIRDLLDERRTGLAAEYDRLSPISGVVSLGERREAGALHTASVESLLGRGSNRSKSSSDVTVRPERDGAVHSAKADVQRGSPQAFARQGMPGGSQPRALGHNTGEGERSPRHRESESPGFAGLGTNTGVTSSSSSDQALWRIHYSRPPSSIAIACGPMTWEALAKKLSLDDETMASLEGLAALDEHGLRLQIIDELAFVYDPIILEGPSTSYLIDWGDAKLNEAAVRFIRRGRIVKPVFHTFFFPVKRGGWYYFGEMTWTPTKVRAMWPKLGVKSKAKLTAKLRDRCDGNLEKEEIMRRIEEGTLEQICIEITKQPGSGGSQAFASRMGFKRGQQINVL